MSSRIKSQLYCIQLSLEKHPKISLIVYIIASVLELFFVISLIITLKSSISIDIFLVMIGVMAITFIYVDYLHLKMIRDQRKQLDARKLLISNLIASVEPEYHYDYLHEIHRILPNGDGIYKRHIKLHYSGSNIMWYSLHMGSTNTEGDFKNLHVDAYTIPDHDELPRITFSNVPRKMQAILILDPPLTNSNPEVELEILVNWPAIWNRAIKDKVDDGRIAVHQEVAELVLEFFPPRRKKITNFILCPQIEGYSVFPDTLNPFGFRCILRNPPRGVYTYSFQLELIKN